MSSKLDQLRSGNAVEIEPGLVGRLNSSDKTLELSNGRKIDASRDPDYFPQNEQHVIHSREKEKIRRETASSPLGEFGFQLGESGLFGAAKDWANKLDLTQTGEDYLRNKQARSAVSEEISEESPYTSLAATATSFVPDLLLTKGMGAAKAGATLTAAHAGPRIVEEPGQVAKETAIGGAGGFILGKAGDWLEKAAARRGLSRQVAQAGPEVTARNAAGQAGVDLANAEQRASYNILKERVGRENEALVHQHGLEVQAQQKRALDSRNAFEKAKFDRESEIFRLKQEKEAAKAARSTNQAAIDREYESNVNAWKTEKKALEERAALDERQYQAALKDLPRLQKEAQTEYGKKVVQTAQDIEKAFHPEGKISSNQLQVAQFLDATVSKGDLAGSSASRNAERVIKAIFPEGEAFGAKELSKRYQSLESAIARSTPEVKGILTQFKEHLGDRLPSALADNIAYKNILPSLRNQVTKEVEKIIDRLPIPSVGDISHSSLRTKARDNLERVLKGLTPDNFISKMQSGEIANLLKNDLLAEADFTSTFAKIGNLKNLKSQGVDHLLKQSTQYQDLARAYQEFSQKVDAKVNSLLARTELKMLNASDKAVQKLGGKVEGTFGSAAPIEPPLPPTRMGAPEAPMRPSPLPEVEGISLPPPVAPPLMEPAPVPPVLRPSPSAPAPQSFSPEGIPTLPAAQGSAEGAGDLLERNLLGGQSLVNNPLTKLAGLKYLFGKAALPAEAGYAALKGLTSPGAGGQAARASFKASGVEALVQLAQKYPSYHDGILEDPQERRSFTKEIEEDPEMTLEEKAINQSKVNRGRSLYAPL